MRKSFILPQKKNPKHKRAFTTIMFACDKDDDFDAQEIVENLYLGSLDAAYCSYSFFEERGIVNVLSITQEPVGNQHEVLIIF